MLNELQVNQKTFSSKVGVSSSTVTGLRKGVHRLTRKTFNKINHVFPDHAHILRDFVDKENVIRQAEPIHDGADASMIDSIEVTFNGMTFDVRFSRPVKPANVKQALIELGIGIDKN